MVAHKNCNTAANSVNADMQVLKRLRNMPPEFPVRGPVEILRPLVECYGTGNEPLYH